MNIDAAAAGGSIGTILLGQAVQSSLVTWIGAIVGAGWLAIAASRELRAWFRPVPAAPTALPPRSDGTPPKP